jgi:hypothetical protein
MAPQQQAREELARGRAGLVAKAAHAAYIDAVYINAVDIPGDDDRRRVAQAVLKLEEAVELLETVSLR